YTFPPVGGAGVARVTKLVKYLPAHGVRPAVLTVANPSVPLEDQSFARDLPPDLELIKARTFEPGYAVKTLAWQADAQRTGSGRPALSTLLRLGRLALLPDPQVLWLPAAARALAGRRARGADDVVFISGPPFSQFLLALLVRRDAAAAPALV